MKAHIGVDSRHKLIYLVAAIAANVHDSHLLPELLHGHETKAWGDSAYQGKDTMIHALAPGVRAEVEHPFLVLKVIFGFRKMRHRGIAKSAPPLNVACARVNLFMLRGSLLRLA